MSSERKRERARRLRSAGWGGFRQEERVCGDGGDGATTIAVSRCMPCSFCGCGYGLSEARGGRCSGLNAGRYFYLWTARGTMALEADWTFQVRAAQREGETACCIIDSNYSTTLLLRWTGAWKRANPRAGTGSLARRAGRLRAGEALLLSH